jgi:hypothetical protein
MTLSAAAKDIDERYVVVGIKTKKNQERKKEGKYQKIPRGGQIGKENKKNTRISK